MSEIIQNISDIFSIISLVFSICCGKFFTTRKKYFFSCKADLYISYSTDVFDGTRFRIYQIDIKNPLNVLTHPETA